MIISEKHCYAEDKYRPLWKCPPTPQILHGNVVLTSNIGSKTPDLGTDIICWGEQRQCPAKEELRLALRVRGDEDEGLPPLGGEEARVNREQWTLVRSRQDSKYRCWFTQFLPAERNSLGSQCAREIQTNKPSA